MKNVMLLFDEIENGDYYKKVLLSNIRNNFNIKVETVDFASGFSSEKSTMHTKIFDFLHEFHEPTFLITNKPIMSLDGIELVYSDGEAHPKHKVGYTSGFNIPNKNLEVITQITLHEIGHMFGLTNHNRAVGLGGKYCFMQQKSNSISWDDYLKDTSRYLCSKCKKDLGIHSFKRRNRF